MENNIKDFGKDHWSLFAYVEIRCIDYKGVLDKNHLRIKEEVDTAGRISAYSFPKWKPEWGTRLSGYWKKDGATDESKKLLDHDDLDCLEDLETANLIESIGTGLFPAYKLTKYGRKVNSKLRNHKADGKNFADFNI